MRPHLPSELLQVLPFPVSSKDVFKITNGLIHHTYRVGSSEKKILLQSINSQIFPDPIGLTRNHFSLFHHFLQPQAPFPLAKPLNFSNGDPVFWDSSSTCWRLSEFVEGTCTQSNVQTPEQAKKLARFFAAFTRFAAGIQDSDWPIPIPRFHDLTFRYEQFKNALDTASPIRLGTCQELTDALIGRRQYVSFYELLQHSEEYPLRMMHHDAKLSNVLIDERSGNWICPIDLDTVMPGYFISDLGDMIRSLCNTVSEDNPDGTCVRFRSEIYESLILGYTSGMGDALTQAERTHIHLAGLLMIYMQTLRFLSDHLNGDIYYQINHPGQNLERARNQFALLVEMESYLDKQGYLSNTR